MYQGHVSQRQGARGPTSYADYTPGNLSYGAYAPPSSPLATATGSSTSSSLLHPTSTTSPSHASAASKSKDQSAGLALLACLVTTLFQFKSNLPLHSFMMLLLLLYTIDLANFRQALLVTTWIAALVMTFLTGFSYLLEQDKDNNLVALTYVLYMAMYGVLYTTGAAWVTLQFQWLKDTHPLHYVIHAVLPPLSAHVFSNAIVEWIARERDRDTAAIIGPFLFAAFLAGGMLFIGTAQKSATSFLIDSRTALSHSTLLLMTPPLSHLATSAGRILSRHAGTDDWYDLILVSTVPFLMLYLINSLHNNGIVKSPYALPRVFPPGGSPIVTMIVSLAASLALQQRYFVPLCHDLSYRLMGRKDPIWLLSLYWSLATLSLLFTGWIWNRKKGANSQEPLLGEYHDDVTQLGIVLFGIAVGKACSLPWNLVPLPVLAFLGFALWAFSRMLRYLIIFLFVLHSAGVVIFTYRFAGIQQTISILGLSLSFMRFGYLVTVSSVIIFFVAGLAVRSNGGYGYKLSRRLDLTGIVLSFYVILLTVLEISMLKQDVYIKGLTGAEGDVEEIDRLDGIYRYDWALFTSGILLFLTYFMSRMKIISPVSTCVAVSLSIGKGVAIYIDSCDEDTENEGSPAYEVFLRSLMTSLLCVVLFAPRVFLKPVYLKTAARYKRSLTDGGGNVHIDSATMRTIFVYAFVFVPATLLVSVSTVIFPIVNTTMKNDSGISLYGGKQPISEIVGITMALWGLSCLSMMNHYLPDGGGEAYKKLSALIFLLGIGLLFAAPSLGLDFSKLVDNPYAAFSTLGSELTRKGKSRTGGWGLLAAGFATLLALTGPLDLRERQSKTGKSDRYLIFRTMMFSLLFGAGISWFIVMQLMSDSGWVVLALTSLSCMALSFVGTISCVLGFFAELDDFDDVVLVALMWGGAFLLFIPFATFNWLFSDESVVSNQGSSWLFTYLIVSSMVSFAFCKSLGSRKTKNSRSRSLGNMGCILSWICSICALYSRCGVASVDGSMDFHLLFGIPLSTLGTVCSSFILLALQSESVGRGAVRKLSTPIPSSRSLIYSLFSFDKLTARNRFYPVLGGASLVFLLATLHVIFLRGSPFLNLVAPVPNTHRDAVSTMNSGEEKINNELLEVVGKIVQQNMVLAASAKLAGSGFWTADSFYGPLLHLIGLVCSLPVHFLLFQSWWRQIPTSRSSFAMSLPINAIPILLCRGIPSLRILSIIGTIGGISWISQIEDTNRYGDM